MANPEIALYVGGLIWKGWQEVSVIHSIDAVFGEFTLNLTRGWPGAAQGNVPPIRVGADCHLTLEGQTVITGYINEVSLQTDSKGFDLRVTGRDRTALLFKGGVLNEPAEWKGLDALAIARAIAKPFGISVMASTDMGQSFGKFTCQPGATANRGIERLCRHRALYHHATRTGGLVLTNADAAPSSGVTLRHGENGNVLTASYSSSLTDRHSEYIVRNQSQGVDWSTGGHSAITARATDFGVPQYCPRVIIPDEPGDAVAAKRLAVAQAALNAGRSRAVDYAVSGWRRTPDGTLWEINEKAIVRDVVADLSETMLIKRVAFTVKPEEAPLTNLTLVDPRAYSLLAEPEINDGGWG